MLTLKASGLKLWIADCGLRIAGWRSRFCFVSGRGRRTSSCHGGADTGHSDPQEQAWRGQAINGKAASPPAGGPLHPLTTSKDSGSVLKDVKKPLLTLFNLRAGQVKKLELGAPSKTPPRSGSSTVN